MRHLSALDALFLHLESPDTPMHVGSLMLLERRPYAALRRHIKDRLHLAPLFTRRLGFMPLDLANPVWLDAGEIDLDYHIRRVKLPAPGNQARLQAAVAKLHEGMLDRERPLWQFTVIEGLEGGEVGLYARIHHAALDGLGGIAVAQALLDTEPRPKSAPAKGAPWKSRLPPSTARMLGAALRNTVSQFGSIARGAPAFLKAAGRAGAIALMTPKPRRSATLGPHTPLNVAIGPKRAFHAVRIPLAEAKEIARHFEVKLNDAVLAIVAGALRRQFAGNRALLSRAMIGAVPASLRAPGDASQANRVTMMLVGLATNVADPVKRLRAIHAAATRAKLLTGSMKEAIPTDMPSLGLPWLMSALRPLYRTAADGERLPAVANVVISSVPGPQTPLYLAGARVLAYFPVSIVTHGLALNVTIVSYDGSLDFGLVACPRALPRLAGFARHLAAEHRALLRLTRGKR
jgi:WS/DGAT/MGAT family acyltransferase